MTGAPGDGAANDAASDAADAARRRSERRAYIRAQHPDAGGDPDDFVRGLARFDPPGTPGSPSSAPRPFVHRSRRPDRVLRHTIRDLRRRLAGQPPRRLK